MTKEALAQPMKFLMVGIVNTIVGYGVMLAAYNFLHWDYWIASAANYVVGSVCSFFLNKYFTFRAKRFSGKEVLRFILCILVCYGIGYGVARPAARLLFQGASPSLQDNLAMLGGSGVFTLLNFVGQKFFVFTAKAAGTGRSLDAGQKPVEESGQRGASGDGD